MKPFYQADNVTLYHADCLAVLPTLAAGSVDAVVTDPPAGIGFMGKKWDRFGREQFIEFLSTRLTECFRVMKPGAYALVWALPRTSHWTGTAIEDAGFTIVDRISHLFGTGFPKHRSKLKPACEDWWLAWKPDRKATPLNIDGCRISIGEAERCVIDNRSGGGAAPEGWGNRGLYQTGRRFKSAVAGRWPANVCLSHRPECNGHCHEDCPVRLLDGQSGQSKSPTGKVRAGTCPGPMGWGQERRDKEFIGHGDTGGASRFFYCAKASRRDRGEGNTHPTVKSTDLMRWLCRLVTPAGGTVLDPFAGSGSTGKACLAEGFFFIGIEREKQYAETAAKRLEAAAKAEPLSAK